MLYLNLIITRWFVDSLKEVGMGGDRTECREVVECLAVHSSGVDDVQAP